MSEADAVKVGVAIVNGVPGGSELRLVTDEGVHITFLLDDAALAALALSVGGVFGTSVLARANTGKPLFYEMNWETPNE